MSVNSFLKAHISTSRDISKAVAGAQGWLAGGGNVRSTTGSWIYICRIKSGFMLEKGVGGVGQQEAEVAHLGPLAWKNVYGFLNINANSNRTIYLRSEFEGKDNVAFRRVLGVLSSLLKS